MYNQSNHYYGYNRYSYRLLVGLLRRRLEDDYHDDHDYSTRWNVANNTFCWTKCSPCLEWKSQMAKYAWHSIRPH